MVLIRQVIRAPMLGLCLVIAVLSIGGSGCSSESSTRLNVQEADKQTLQKAAEQRKQRAIEKAKLPRSKQKSFD